MTATAHINELHPHAVITRQRPASSWIAELLLKSAHMVCLVCPLCGRLNTATCVLCQASLCPTHDVAYRVVREVICQPCWRDY